ncbi:hypothetical protein LAZ67_21001068 [Cordylochernes scorpioides]|uniref:Transposase n=1 Tax=Cordylochernes scorpioides TaxID=51811 RepID=A0ABY6LLQ2_9ARAC|nr:hypothetical protein LAZ67_21001068 [Cordylochernes scorpioides]
MKEVVNVQAIFTNLHQQVIDQCASKIFTNLHQQKSVTGDIYPVTFRDRLKEELRAKRPRLAQKKIPFHQDNAPPHMSNVSATKFFDLGFQLVPHLPYSPDLVPCEFLLFPNLKKWLGGRTFSSNEEVIDDVIGYFEDLETSYCSEGIKKNQNIAGQGV